jgi:hypothetical protein
VRGYQASEAVFDLIERELIRALVKKSSDSPDCSGIRLNRDVALALSSEGINMLLVQCIEIFLLCCVHQGWELPLPAKLSFTGNYGHKRTQLRSRWWLPGTPSYRAAGIHDIDSEVLEEQLVQPGQLPGYHPAEVPVFTEHY